MPDSILPDYREEWLIQPQFTRYHHAYRSPRSSERLNLEMSQFAYDVNKLYQLVEELQTEMLESFDTIVDLDPSNVPSAMNITMTIEDLNEQLRSISDRLEILEKGL